MDRVLPIAGQSKAKRLGWSTPQNQFSVPFLKLMREGNKTRKVYAVNPYVETYRFRDNLYGLLHPNLDGGSDVWSWLIIGPARALLIGTGFGLGDTAGLVKEISGGLPVVVVNSHSGRDQILGNGRFDTVHCHEYDADTIRKTSRPAAFNSLFDAAGRGRWYEFDRKDLPTKITHQLVPVKDGHRFDLGGGYEVELVWTGGYTPGHVMAIDRQSRCLFPGDNVSSDTIRCGMGPVSGVANGRYANLTVFRDRLTTIIRRMDDFDYLFPARGMVNLENHLLNDMKEALDHAIAKPDAYNFISRQKGPAGEEVREKYITGFSSIAYTMKGIRPSGGF